MINNDYLYAYNSNQISVYRISDQKLIESIQIGLNNHQPISVNFISDYCVLRHKTFLDYINLKSRKKIKKTILGLDLSDSNLQMRVIDEEKIIFFNNKTNEYFCSSS